MKRPCICALVMVFVLASCGVPTAESPTPDIQATAQSAINATTTAQVVMQETIQSAVESTATAMPQPATPVPSSDVSDLTEEELAALIEQSVQEATLASQEAIQATTDAAADSIVSDEEVITVQVQLSEAEAILFELEEILGYYEQLYGEYASEATDAIYTVESDLEEIATSLNEINQILAEGAEAATAAVEQLNTAVQTASQSAQAAQEQIQGWQESVKNQLATIEETMLSYQPNEIFSDRQGALDQTQAYITSLRGAMEDNKISPNELENIAQLGANATASLKANGGALSVLSSRISELTSQAARDQTQQLRLNLDSFESSLPARQR